MTSRRYGGRVGQARARAGLTQAALARRAGLSRQQVAAVEAGRHAPSVDAALRLAAALATPVEALFGPAPDDAPTPLAGALRPGQAVKLGRVGDRTIAIPLSEAAGAGGWANPDGLAEPDGVRSFPGGGGDGLVVAGCDPVLGLAEALLAGRGPGRLVAAEATSGAALDALSAERCHAALVHGPANGLPLTSQSVRRWHLAGWRVGIAVPAARREPSLAAVGSGRITLIQREASAASQQAFLRALAAAGGSAAPRGPLAVGHIDAARRGAMTRRPAVTFEPAARAYGMGFRPLEEHVVQIWIAERFVDHPGVAALGDLLASRAFRDRVAAIGGYDLTDCGARVPDPPQATRTPYPDTETEAP